MESFAELKALIEGASDDVEKSLGGNRAAGTRVRKAMQDIKKKAQQIRQELIAARAK